MISAIAAGLPLADNEFGDTQTDGIAGPLGLLVIVVLVIATVLLIRNMSGRIKRLPSQFDAPPSTARTRTTNRRVRRCLEERPGPRRSG